MRILMAAGSIAGFLYALLAFGYGTAPVHQLMGAVGFFFGLTLLGLRAILVRLDR